MNGFPTLDDVYTAFGPKRWRYALEHIDKAVQVNAPCINRLDIMYSTKDADEALFMDHLVKYYLTIDFSGKQPGQDVCSRIAAIFLGRYGSECTLVKLLCYFANYPEFKESFRTFDPEDIIIQYNKKFKEWWGSQAAKYGYNIVKPQTDDKQPCGLDGLKLTVRGWIEKGEDPRQNILYKFSHGVTDEMIAEVEKEIALGVF